MPRAFCYRVETPMKKPGDEPSEESWGAFERYLRKHFPPRNISRVGDPGSPNIERFGFTVEVDGEVHALRVRYEFWRDYEPAHIEPVLAMLDLAADIRRHRDVR